MDAPPADIAPARWRRIDDADLRPRHSFRVAARASRLYLVDDATALPELFANGELDAGAIIIGGGSNLLFAANPDVSLLQLRAAAVHRLSEDVGHVRIRAEAGANWHALVMWTLEHGLPGLENLALIPGTVGAAPIQNIGAYGVEVGEYIDIVEAFDRSCGRLRRLHRDDCAFAYRDSLFKRQPQRWVVTAVEFVLPRSGARRIGYAGLDDELRAMGIHNPGPRQIAEAVIRLRRRKLPDPARIGNAGSFFKNPIIPQAQAEALQALHPQLPVHPSHHVDQRKLSAAWLIERCGWKGHRDADAGVCAEHALVLVNHGHASGRQLLALARRIAESVLQRFGIAIEPEPRIIGARW